MTAPTWPLTILYDASCPLCAAEMQTIRDHDKENRLILVDCSAPDFRDEDATAKGYCAEELMRKIHARDAAGRWYRGVDVFALAYGAAGLDSIARLWASRRLRPVLLRLYPWIARHRHWLSRLGLHAPFSWLIRRAARQ